MVQEATKADLVESAAQRVEASLPRTREYFDRARKVLPGGTTRNRFFWPFPIIVERAEGSHIFDIDGNDYIDCCLGFGPMILGHRHPEVMEALRRQLDRGVMFGAPPREELDLAETIASNVPGAERVMFVNSGTEATLAAIRFARAKSGRDKVAKFEGGWHGWHDWVLHSFYAPEGEPENAVTTSATLGAFSGLADYAVTLPFNHPGAFDRIRREAKDLACVIVEGVLGGGGSIPADPEFMRQLRDVCTETGVLLIMDEVITGFRLGPDGAAGYYGVVGDLTTLGKVLGGGMPIGAICGRGDLLDLTLGREEDCVLFSGTFSNNPMSMIGGKTQLDVLLRDGKAYEKLAVLGGRMRDGLESAFAQVGIRGFVTGVGSMWGIHFTPERPTSIRDQVRMQKEATTVLSGYLLQQGVFMMAPVHLGFVSTAHTKEEVDFVVEAHVQALSAMKSEGFFG
jgi:glutamate-1-semialdehyde 2,1-aminomutase